MKTVGDIVIILKLKISNKNWKFSKFPNSLPLRISIPLDTSDAYPKNWRGFKFCQNLKNMQHFKTKKRIQALENDKKQQKRRNEEH